MSLKKNLKVKYLPRKAFKKYRNEKISIGGIIFDSKLEQRVYADLLMIPGIKEIVTHVKIPIVYNDVKICNVIPDFEIHSESGKIFYADAKSEATETAVSALKFRLILAHFGKKVYLLPKETILLKYALNKNDTFTGGLICLDQNF